MRKVEEDKSRELIDYFLKNNNTISSYTIDDINDLLQLCIWTYNLATDKILKSNCITVLYDIAFLEQMRFEDCWQIYWIISSITFSDNEVNLQHGELDILYSHIFNELKNQINIPEQYIPIENRTNKVVIITSQFLGIEHAPSVRVMDYSYHIQKYLNKQVIIINDSGMNYSKNPLLEPSVKFNYRDDYNDVKYIEYKDEKFEFFQVKTLMPDVSIIQKLLYIIADVKPILVYNIGGSSLVSDLCTSFTTTVCIPCATSIPISMSKYLLVPHKIDVDDRGRINRLASYQKLIETKVNFQIKETNRNYTRNQFHIDNDSFLISIVGNRLDMELDQYFLQTLDHILSIPNVNVLFVGDINDLEKINKNLNDISKVYFAGLQPDASEIIKLTDLFLNPKRKGGGRSSFEALYYKVPVITLKYGDVYHICGEEFAVHTYEDMYNKVKDYILNKKLYNEMRKIAGERAIFLGDITKTQEEIINTIINSEMT